MKKPSSTVPVRRVSSMWCRGVLGVVGFLSLMGVVHADPGALIDDARPQAGHVREAIRRYPTRGSYSVIVVPQTLATGREILRLQGEAESEQVRDDLLKAARGATALSVVDEMTLQKPRPDSEIQGDIQRTLQDEYPALVSRVKVSVQDGVVRLGGDLENHRDVDKVLASVNMVRGVRDFVSEITIHGRPYTQKHGEAVPK